LREKTDDFNYLQSEFKRIRIVASQEEYQQKIENIRQAAWDRYKKDLPIK
jgi:hypothetical protein